MASEGRRRGGGEDSWPCDPGVQVAIFAAARSIDGRGIVESMGSAINGAFAFWAVGVVLVLILSLFE